MPAVFHQVPPSIWARGFRDLSTVAKVVAFYVMTCRAKVTEGLFELPLHYVVGDTGLTVDEVREAFAELDRAGRVSYDGEAEVVLDRDAVQRAKYGEGDKRLKGAVARFLLVPDSLLKDEFRDLVLAECSALAILLPPGPSNAPPKRLASPTEGASREEASREQGEGKHDNGCSVPGCIGKAKVRDGLDGDLYCGEHEDHPFGTAVLLDDSL